MSNNNDNNDNDKNNNDDGGGGNQSDLSNKIEEIMILMDQRARGHASTEQVEAAVSSILGTLGAVPPLKKRAKTRAGSRNSSTKSTTKPAISSLTTASTTTTIQVDQGNYDDDDDDEEDTGNHNDGITKNNDNNNNHQEDVNHLESKQASDPSSSAAVGQVTTTGTDYNDGMSMQDYQELLKEIPMGRVGAQMMTAFGDGSRPNVEALQLALEGTRRALQYIVMDARALRRRIKLQYTQAQQETLAGHKTLPGHKKIPVGVAKSSLAETTSSPNNATTTTSNTTTAVPGPAPLPSTDPHLVYRALLTDQSATHDPLGRHPPCGFDVEQLARLYPEELQAYDRWNELHEEYEHPNPADEDGEDNPQVPKTTEQEQQQDYLGGHLKERVAVFNIRTDHMPQDMYLHFSRIRQGSFLPRGRGRHQTQLEKEWNNFEIKRGRGRGGTWLHMPAITVRFLHWLGFQPPDVPPPDTETTQVLAFLGHDRMGRIVEKAIQLRNFQQGKDALEFRELPPWEQLTVQEIQAALDDPDVKPAPLFPFDDKHDGLGLPNVQLYFGPGFEQRLELEMEEMLAASSSSQREHEDVEVRLQEREFFQKLSKPVQELDGLAFLVEDHKKNKQLEEDSEVNVTTGIDPARHDSEDDNPNLDMTRNDTPRKPKKSRVSKPKQQQERDEPTDPNSGNEPVTAATKSAPRNNKRLRSK